MTPSTSETVPRHAAAVTLLTQLATTLFQKAMAVPESECEVFWERWESLRRIAMSIAIRQSIHFSPVDEAELDEALRMAVNVGGPNEYHLVEQFNRLLEAEIAEINRRAVTA